MTDAELNEALSGVLPAENNKITLLQQKTDAKISAFNTTYDVAKIDSINKLFITQKSDLSKQMSFDKFNYNNKLFLKYPTYISGFDYPFYFK